jgi:hypothetical protein
MAERLNAAVLKTVLVKANGGSNPSFSAAKNQPHDSGVFCFAADRIKASLECGRVAKTKSTRLQAGLIFAVGLPTGMAAGNPITQTHLKVARLASSSLVSEMMRA